jgi:O-antigen ligase
VVTGQVPADSRAHLIVFAGVFLTLAFASDPRVHPAGGEPRVTLLAVGAGLALLFWCARTLRARADIAFSLVEALLAARLLWGLAIDPGWIHDRRVSGLCAHLAFLVIAFLCRQAAMAARDAEGEAGRSGRVGVSRGFLNAVWLCALSQAVLGLAQAAVAPNGLDGGLTKTPLLGTLGAANAFGALMGVGFVAALGAGWIGPRGWWRRSALAAAPVIGGALVLNGSRGAALGVAGAGALAVWARWVVDPRSEARTRRRMLVATPAAIGLMALLTLGLHRMSPESGEGRLISWSLAADMVRDRPITGIGPGRFGVVHPAYQAAYFEDPDHREATHKATFIQHAHSIYVTATAETGVPGGLLFVLPWAVALLGLAGRAPPDGAPAPRARLAVLGVLGAILVHGAVDAVLLHPLLGAVAYAAAGLAPAPTWTWRLAAAGAKRRPLAPALALALGAVAVAAGIMVPAVRAYPGRLLWRQGLEASRPEEAVARLRAARERLPWEGRVAGHLGQVLLRAGRPGEAIEPLTWALALHGDPAFHIALSQAYVQEGDTLRARVHADSAIAIYPDRIGPHLAAARVHHAAGRDADARTSLTRCILRQTRVQSAAVEALAREAERMWRTWYGEPLPAAG